MPGYWQNGEETCCEALDVLFFGRWQRRNRLGHGSYDAQTTTRELFRLALFSCYHREIQEGQFPPRQESFPIWSTPKLVVVGDPQLRP